MKAGNCPPIRGSEVPVRKLAGLAPTLLLLATVPAVAHYNMLLPEATAAKKGEAVTLLYQWGHPFEHHLFDAPQPESLSVVAPDGRRTDILASLKKTTIPTADGKSVTAFRCSFT